MRTKNKANISLFYLTGARIKKLREKIGMSQLALAGKIDVTKNSIICWENGKSNPSKANLIKLAKVFNVPPELLLPLENPNDKVESADSLGAKIKNFREQKGISHIELAKKLSVRTRNVTSWERDVNIPNQSSREKLAEIFGVSPEELKPQKSPANKRNTAVIGQRIEILRTKNDMTIMDFAEKVGAWDVTVKQWESGTYAPKTPKLLKIAEMFDVSSEWLIHGIGSENDKFEGERIDLQKNQPETLTSTEKYIISTFGLLSDFDKTRLIGYIDALRDAGLAGKVKTG